MFVEALLQLLKPALGVGDLFLGALVKVRVGQFGLNLAQRRLQGFNLLGQRLQFQLFLVGELAAAAVLRF